MAQSDPNVVWAGTGDAWAIRDSDVAGNGVYKSVDAGKTWKHMGLEETGRIGRIVINPHGPNNVFACALGRLTGPRQESGVFRTNDGGQHWDRVLFADPNTGCSGLVMDPQNSRTLFAGMWQVEMHTDGEFSGGPGSGVCFASRWLRIRVYLPQSGRYDPPNLVKLRTAAPDNPYIWNEPRFRDADFRTITHWGIRQAEVGPLVNPGKYTIQVTVKGQTYKQPIEVLKSLKTPATEAELEASLKLQLRIREDITATSDMVNRLEWMRKQLEDLRKMLRTQSGSADLLRAVQAMDGRMQGVEFKLISRSDANSDDKYYVEAYKIYLNLIWLNGEVGTGAGDVAGGANYGLTDTVQEILAGIEKDLAAVKADYRTLIDRDLAAFNKQLSPGGAVAVTAGN